MKNLIKFLTLVTVPLLFISLIVSCNEKTTKPIETVIEVPFNLAAVKAEIETANEELIALIVIGDSIGIAKKFTADAKFMMTGSPSISGTGSIQSTFSGMITSGISNLNLETTEIWGSENFITEEGEYAIFVEEAKVDYGKYIVLWKKEEGKWRLHRDMISSNVPVPE